MSNVLDTSLLVQTVKRAAARIRQLNATSASPRYSPPDPAPRRDDDARVTEVLENSRLLRWIDAAIDVPPRAWKSSALRRYVEPIAREFLTLSSADRLRVIGWVVVVATATHIALVVAFAEPIGWPTWVAWLSFLALASVPVAWPSGVVAAWANRRPWVRRLLREPEPWQ
ncbi:MAG: hypothetical protein HY047_21595 [Acidobacteria bacterium]|nr:hypothetical protein [Acidobacteriota bacterium]